jgi:ParB family chromosome partitioning protein
MIVPKTNSRPKGLGRGLEVLLGAEPSSAAEGAPHQLALHRLQPGRYQPRTRMDEQALQDLADSIMRHGIMQPILVRPLAVASSHEGPQRFEIIAGERRFRAARQAGLDTVPVIVREVADDQALSMALIENIQREDLNPLEEAQALKRLIEEFSFSHEQVAQAVGRSRSAASNLLRLLQLAEPVQTMLLAGDLDMGHARALLALDRARQIQLAHEVVQRRLSVRECERLVSKALRDDGSNSTGNPRSQGQPSRDHQRLEELLSDALSTPVSIKTSRLGGGTIRIDFVDIEHFEGLMQRMGLSIL